MRPTTAASWRSRFSSTGSASMRAASRRGRVGQLDRRCPLGRPPTAVVLDQRAFVDRGAGASPRGRTGCRRPCAHVVDERRRAARRYPSSSPMRSLALARRQRPQRHDGQSGPAPKPGCVSTNSGRAVAAIRTRPWEREASTSSMLQHPLVGPVDVLDEDGQRPRSRQPGHEARPRSAHLLEDLLRILRRSSGLSAQRQVRAGRQRARPSRAISSMPRPSCGERSGDRLLRASVPRSRRARRARCEQAARRTSPSAQNVMP